MLKKNTLKFKDFLAIIPARKGSVSIKNKNLTKIRKKKLIEYTLVPLNKLKLAGKCVVSNDLKLKNLAKKYKIDTNYKRPEKTSLNTSSLLQTLVHFKIYADKYYQYKYFLILQPTSPLRTYNEIYNSIKCVIKNNYSSLYSVSESFEHPYETIYLKKNKVNYFLNEGKKYFRRQDYPKESFFINGSIFITNKKNIENKKLFNFKNHGIYFTSKISSFDLNDYEDLKIIKKIIS